MIYLDYQATTPLAPEVADAMVAAMDHYGNPNSAHRIGRIAAADVELARGRILDALGRADGRLIFTSGATEALNMAIIGAARAAPHSRRRVVTVATEHAAVLDTVMALRREGFEPVIVPVNADGLVDLEIAEAAIDERAALLAVMQANNEIGVVQPLDRLFVIARAAGVPTLCDAVQGFGRLATPQADLIAISAHKIHGPKGVGALWLREGLDLPPLMHGGGQEQGVRPGTLSPMLCAGFGVAAQLAAQRRYADLAHVEALWTRALELFADWHLNGTGEARYHGNLNLRRAGLDAARLISDVRTVAVSLGSACASGSGRPSHVLKAMGLSDAEARSSLRIGMGRYTSMADLEEAASLLNKAADAQGVPA
ncbi:MULTISPECIES: cysteine desulfurase family protein [unclassified Sphingobium]|uniref:cysteine desulfurase family protein n=1 Tax=unclassified Sphingobium TaxID=2611147 RepID=UPI002224BDA5|nr:MULTISPECIES: cysteine desulfurase family protein [unclassified Sphingobium]MCW2391467.1 cysteine desulfurase [Sphingobium sp. B11D3A]